MGGQIRTLPLVMCQEPVPVPSALETASGFKVVPAAEELVRLEGHHWATHWAEGQGPSEANHFPQMIYRCSCFLWYAFSDRVA